MRSYLIGGMIVAALVAVGWAWFALRPDPASDYALVVRQVDGPVAIERENVRRAAEASEVLRAEDRVATGVSGNAVLALGPETEIRVGPASTVQVTEVSEAGVSIELEGGALEARVRPSSGAVRVGSRGRAVEASDGTFRVGVQDDLLQVHVEEGTARLRGMDVEEARAGQDVLVIEDHGRISAAAERVLVDLAWPDPAPQAVPRLTVLGTTTPGAEVTFTADGVVLQVVRADAAGTFTAELPLAAGQPQTVDVGVIDLVGRTGAIRGLLPPRQLEFGVIP